MPSIIKVDQIQSDTGTINVTSNLASIRVSSSAEAPVRFVSSSFNEIVRLQSTTDSTSWQQSITGYNAGNFYWQVYGGKDGSNAPFCGLAAGTNGTTTTLGLKLTGAGVVELPLGQLKFPSSQNASSDPNTLDDYEEGTFTPTFRSDGDNALITFSTSARYIKIGTYVYFTILATRNQSSVPSGTLYMQSLPFTSISSSPTIQLGGISWFDNGGVTADYTAITYLEGGSNTVYFTQFTNPSQQAAARYVQAQNLSNNRPIYITGSYTTAS